MSNLFRFNSAVLPISLAMPTAAHLPFLVNGEPATLLFPSPAPGSNFDASLANSTLAGIPFILRTAGLTNVVSGTQYQIDIAQVGAADSLTAIASTGLLTATASIPDNWFLEASCLWDDTTEVLRGSFSGFSGNASNQVISLSALEDGGLTGMTAASLIFCVAVTVNTTNSANSFELTDFGFDFK